MKRSARPSSRRRARRAGRAPPPAPRRRAREVISSQTSRSGSRRERAGDRDALALAARELAGEARRRGAPAGAPARAGRRPRPRASRRDRPRSTRAGRAISSATRWRGLSESYGFWKTIWIRRRASRGRRLRLALRAARRRAGSARPTARAGRRRSARSSSCRSPTRRRARGTRRGARSNETSVDRDDRLVAPGRSRRAAPRPRAAARLACAASRGGQRLARPRAAASRATRSSATAWPRRDLDAERRHPPSQRATRCGQRGANAQPAARSPDADGDARDPAQPARRDVVGDRGDEPARVRVARPRAAPRRRARSRRCGRRTSRRCGRRSRRRPRGRG